MRYEKFVIDYFKEHKITYRMLFSQLCKVLYFPK